MRGKIVTAFIFLTMMTGAVSAAPVLDYAGAERLEEARQREEDRQERLRMPRVEIWEAVRMKRGNAGCRRASI